MSTNPPDGSSTKPPRSPPSVLPTHDIATSLPPPHSSPLSNGPSVMKSSSSSFFIDPLEVINMGSSSQGQQSPSPYMENVSGEDSTYWARRVSKLAGYGSSFNPKGSLKTRAASTNSLGERSMSVAERMGENLGIPVSHETAAKFDVSEDTEDGGSCASKLNI
jgi:hypothetical protein